MKNNDKDVTIKAEQHGAINAAAGAEAERAETKIQVEIPALHEYIGIARDAVDAFGEQLHFPPDARAAIKLAVGEACNNAVIHPALVTAPSEAMSNSESSVVVAPIVIAARADGDALEIDVTNRGNGFHPVLGGAMPDADAEHGRGIALMEMLMDSVEYLSVNGNTMVRLRKRIRPDAGLALVKP